MSTPVTLRTRDRPTGPVQAVGRRPADIERRGWESLSVFAVFAGGYLLVGYWLVVDMHVVGFETLDRLNRALMVWHNNPPKLSAIGFAYPPLATLLVAPLAVFRGLAQSLALVPLASAVFAGLVMVSLNTMLRRAEVVAPLRAAVLLALGANPLVVLYAASGAGQFLWIAFVVTAVGALVAWYVTADIRFVMIAGLSFSIASLAGYSSLVWFLLGAIMIGAILARLGSDGTEVEGTLVGFTAPTVYVIALWTAFNVLLLHDPIAWITSTGASGQDTMSVVEVLRGTGDLVLYGAPLAIVVLPALVFAGFARGNSLAVWLGVMLAASILLPAACAALGISDSPMAMSNALPILMFAAIGAIWLARSADARNNLVSALLVLGLVVSIPWTFQAMKTYRYQNLESSFAAAVSTRQSQEGTVTRNGEVVGIASEQEMADYIAQNVTHRGSVLTDNAQTYGVMLLTGHPELFFDRVDRSDGPWKQAAAHPATYVDYMLLSTNTSSDLLSRLYPAAAAGTDGLLPVVYRTARYVLVQVPAGYTSATDTSQGSGSTS